MTPLRSTRAMGARRREARRNRAWRRSPWCWASDGGATARSQRATLLVAPSLWPGCAGAGVRRMTTIRSQLGPARGRRSRRRTPSACARTHTCLTGPRRARHAQIRDLASPSHGFFLEDDESKLMWPYPWRGVDEPGDAAQKLSAFASCGALFGMAWDGEHLWVTDRTGANVKKVATNGAPIDSYVVGAGAAARRAERVVGRRRREPRPQAPRRAQRILVDGPRRLRAFAVERRGDPRRTRAGSSRP